MSWNDWRGIPKYAIDTQKKYSKTQLEATQFNIDIRLYDSTDDDTGTGGFGYEEDLVKTINSSSGTTDIDIALTTTNVVPNSRINARYIRNTMSQKPDIFDASSLIYTNKKPVFYSNTEIEKTNRLLFATVNQDALIDDGSTIDNKVSREIEIFVIEEIDPQYDENGDFQYTKLTLKKINPEVARKGSTSVQTGTDTITTNTQDSYVRLNFFRTTIQPRNWKRRKYTFKDKPIMFGLTFKGEDDQLIDWEFSDREKIEQEIFYQPFAPKLEGNSLTFFPIWSNEILWLSSVRDKFGEEASSLSSWDSTATAGGINNKLDTPGNVGDSRSEVYALKGNRYKYGYFGTSILSGGQDGKRDDLIKFGQDILGSDVSLVSTFNIMNFTIAKETTDATNSTSLIRAEDQKNAPWITWKYESIFSYDSVSNVLSLAVGFNHYLHISEPIKTVNIVPNLNNDDLDFDKDTYIEGRVDFLRDLLQGKATLMGEALNNRPPDTVSEAFDVSGNPQTWNKEELKRWIGWYPIDFDKFDTLGGIDGLIEKGSVDNSTTALTRSIKYGLGQAQYRYASATNYKTRAITKNWYEKTTGEWELEIEVADGISRNLTQVDMRYFGGYQYKVEDFQNTKQEAIDNGEDVYCVDGNGNWLITTYRAENRNGTPLRILTSKVYASSSESKLILIEENKKLIKENSKFLYNVNNGNKVPNKKYKGD